MNPATPGPLTVLLVPPVGDVALLADECGGRVPQAWLTMSPHPTWRFDRPSPGSPAETRATRALILVDRGASVAMGCDRFVRCVNAVTRSPGMLGRPVLRLLDDYGTDEDVARTAQREAHRIGARVVLLRDGREVGS